MVGFPTLAWYHYVNSQFILGLFSYKVLINFFDSLMKQLEVLETKSIGVIPSQSDKSFHTPVKDSAKIWHICRV